MAYFLFNAYQAGELTHQEIFIMLLCKVVYHFERKWRIAADTRADYGVLHSFEHLDLYLFIVVTQVPLAERVPEWTNLAYLVLAAACASLRAIRHGDNCRALLGAFLLLFADWYIYHTGFLAVASTLVYLKSRG